VSASRLCRWWVEKMLVQLTLSFEVVDLERRAVRGLPVQHHLADAVRRTQVHLEPLAGSLKPARPAGCRGCRPPRWG